jgi:putative DNA primase/helicase
LDNRFAIASLYRKLANVDADLSGDTLKNTGVLKKLTGNDLLPGENKFQNPFRFKNQAKLIFSCNEMPNTEDITDAFFRRLIIINFNKQFFGLLEDPHILDKLTTPEELSGLFRVILSRLPRVLKHGLRTIDSATIESTFDKYIGNKDPAELFFIRAIEKTGNPDDVIMKNEVYESYKLFCKVHGLVCSEQSLSRRLRSKGVHSYRDNPDSEGRRPYYWYEIKLGDWKTLDDKAPDFLGVDELSDKERENLK